MTTSYTITATPKVIERVYYAIERCISRPEASAQAINREIEAKFGAPLSTQIWTTINLARRDNALSRVKTKTFDFSRHGRVARTGKQKTKPTRHQGAARQAADEPPMQRIRLNPRKHPRYTVAVWQGKCRAIHDCRTRKQADRLIRKLVRDGLPLADIAVYRAEALAIRLAIRE